MKRNLTIGSEKIPEEVLNLFYLVSVKIRAQKIKASSISIENNQIIIRFSTAKEYTKKKLPQLGGNIRTGKNAYLLPLASETEVWKKQLHETLILISELI